MEIINNENPPILEGIYDVLSVTYGYIMDYKSGRVNEYTFDNPLTEKYQSVYEQKGEFVNTYYIPIKTPLKKGYGVWRRKLNQNLEFIGWECLYIGSNDEKVIYILDPVEIKNNKVFKYTVTILNVGNNFTNNFNQTSYISKFTGTKID